MMKCTSPRLKPADLLDLEGSGARSRLDAVLQVLVEKSETEREQSEDDTGKIATDSLNKDLSPSSAGKRPSSRFPQHRRKKRKEMDDGLPETNQHKQNAYVIKLFDRSVDLAQFNTSTPLYPICRAWMKNNPSVRERAASPSPPHSIGEEELTDSAPVLGSVICDHIERDHMERDHMERWKKIRQKWKESSNKNQLRYGESIRILKEMYDR
ncbi:protein lin-37 homolog isoform X3 [Lampris incognitus]|uniref:protein lin-37 homolog isoform X3 n=1 Tax=Lampris incognitus TaxID=2546036 RepID=UPI0024B4E8EC|nr:protein lin-37 homolog isoform X3 [Lampris incognitus]